MRAFERPKLADYTQLQIGDLLADTLGTVDRAVARYEEDLFRWRVRMFFAGVALWTGLALMVIGAGTVRSWFGG